MGHRSWILEYRRNFNVLEMNRPSHFSKRKTFQTLVFLLFVMVIVTLLVAVWILQKEDSQVSSVFRISLGINICGKRGRKRELCILLEHWESRTALQTHSLSWPPPPISLELKWPVRVNPGGIRPLSVAWSVIGYVLLPEVLDLGWGSSVQLEQFLKDCWGIWTAFFHVHLFAKF